MIGRIATLARRGNDESGLSMIELMVAIGILLVALVALARTATVAFSDVAASRQRQAGSQLANRLLEEVRALPYESVQKGLADSDLAGDPDITQCGGIYYYPAPSCPAPASAEELVHTPGLPNTNPLVPHEGQTNLEPATFDWAVYVTEAEDAPSAGAYRVTARVTWEANVREGLRNFVQAQTLIYSPDGCVDPATHPFAAPCQPYFYGNGSVGNGNFTTTGQVDNVDFDSVGADLLGQSADAQVEQITRVEGSVNLPLGFTVVNGTRTETTPTAASSAADDDPSSPAGAYQLSSAGPQAPGSISAQGGGNVLAVQIGGSSAGSTRSTTNANTTNSCNLQLDDRPCGYATATPAGSVTETLALAGGVGTATLASAGTTGTASTSYVRRFIPGGQLVGLVRETLSWTLPTITVGGLPSGLANAPAGWNGYWVRLTGFTVTATAEAGQSTVAPTFSIGGGQVSYWNGSGYSTQAVTAAGAVLSVADVDHLTTAGGQSVQVQMDGTVSIQPSQVVQQLSGTDRLVGESSIGSPLVVDMDYQVSTGPIIVDPELQSVANLDLQVNAGTAKARAVYRPAPTG
jgi:hypothetical protein